MKLELEHFASDQMLDPAATRSITLVGEPTTALYRRAQMIFEGVDYCMYKQMA